MECWKSVVPNGAPTKSNHTSSSNPFFTTNLSLEECGWRCASDSAWEPQRSQTTLSPKEMRCWKGVVGARLGTTLLPALHFLHIICWRPVIQYGFPRAVLIQKAQRKQRPSFEVVGMQTSSCSFHDKLHLKLNCWCAFVCGSLTPSATQAFIYRSQISALKILCSIVIVSLGFSNNKQGGQHMLVI